MADLSAGISATHTIGETARTCLIVLGMHRSGTSALTRVIALAGADLPATLLGGDQHNLNSNAKGHWESEPIVRMNDRILASAGTNWRSPEAMPADWYKSSRYEQFLNEAVALLHQEFGASPLFVMKDPRVCKLLPFWLAVLEECGIAPIIINMVRNPLEVAHSLWVRNRFELQLGELMWLRYVLEAERNSRGYRRLHVSYDALLEDWSPIIEGLQSLGDISWPSMSVERRRQISAFLSVSDRHHTLESETATGDGIGEWSAELFAILKRWTSAGENEADFQRIDEISNAFTAATRPLMAHLLIAYEKSIGAEKLQKLRAEQAATIERQTAEIKLYAQREKLFGEDLAKIATAEGVDDALDDDGASSGDKGYLRHLKQIVDTLKFRNTELSKNSELLEAQFDSEKANLKDELQDLRLYNLELREKLVLLTGELEASRSENARSNDDVARLTLDNESLKDQNTAFLEKLSGLEDNIGSLQATCDEYSVANAQLAFDNAQLENRKTKLVANCAKLESVTTALNTSLERMQAELGAQKSIHRRKWAERVLDLDSKLSSARELATVRTQTISKLRDDLAKLVDQRDRMFAALTEVRQDRTERLAEKRAEIREFGLEEQRWQKRLAAERGRSRDLQKNFKMADERASALEEQVLALRGQVKAATERTLKHRLRKLLGSEQPSKQGGAVAVLRTSALFDAVYYLEHNPDVRLAGVDPLEHYADLGGLEGRAPSAAFDGRWYLDKYPDVAEAGINPLVHYLAHGQNESRQARPVASRIEGTGSPEVVARAQDPVTELPEETRQHSKADTADAQRGAGFENEYRHESTDPACDEQPLMREELTDGYGCDEPHAEGVAPAAGGYAIYAQQGQDWKRSLQMTEATALVLGNVRVALAGADRQGKPDQAVELFKALVSGKTAHIDADASNGPVRMHMANDTVGITNAWLSADYTLQLMIVNRNDDHVVVRICQATAAQDVVLCEETCMSGKSSLLLKASLADRFTPILVVVTRASGEFLDASLLPFPSMLQGGLHHSELVATETGYDQLEAFACYTHKILGRLWNADDAFAISELAVDIENAHGGELIFASDLRAWIARQFGVGIHIATDTASLPEAKRILASRLETAPSATVVARSAGRSFHIAADAIPSLAILTACDGEVSSASNLQSLFASGPSMRPVMAVTTPLFGDAPAKLMPQPFVPEVVPAEDGTPQPVIGAIEKLPGTPTDVRAAFPCSPERKPLDTNIALPPPGPFSVIVKCSGDVSRLAVLLASLTNQKSATSIECILIGKPPECDQNDLLPLACTVPLTLVSLETDDCVTLTSLSRAIMFASHSRVMLLDDCKVLHDSRTFELLAAMCSQGDVGSAAAQIAAEPANHKSPNAFDVSLGWTPVQGSPHAQTITQPLINDMPLPDFVSLAANPLWCMMVERERWLAGDQLEVLEDRATALNNPDLAVGEAFRASGQLNLSTSLIAIGDISPDNAMPKTSVETMSALPAKVLTICEF